MCTMDKNIKTLSPAPQADGIDDEQWQTHRLNPRNWSPARKWLHVCQLPYLTILQRLFKMLFTEPLVTVIGVYTAISFAITYGLLASVPYIFGHVYGFDLAQSGLTWIGSIVGDVFGAISNVLLQRHINKRKQRHSKSLLEWSLIPSIIGSPLIPAGCFLAGMQVGRALDCPSCRFGSACCCELCYSFPHNEQLADKDFFSQGASLCYNSSLAYLAQFYGPKYGASAAAGAQMLSFYFGMAFPLFSLPRESSEPALEHSNLADAGQSLKIWALIGAFRCLALWALP